MPNTNQLLLFLDVVQQGSFTKAATLHDMDNSSLSKQIKKLEQDLGVQLLNRSTRSFSLTSAGEDILAQTYVLKDTINQIQGIADSYQSEPKGVLRITSPIYFGQQYLQPIITQFMRKYPDVQIVLSLDDKIANIIAGQFDIAFRFSKLVESNLIAKKIADSNFMLVASNDFVKEHGEPKTPQDLLALPAVIYTNGDMTVDHLRISEEPHGNTFQSLTIRGNYKVSDVRTMVSCVKDGLGYGFLDQSNLYASMKELGLVSLLPDYPISTIDTAIYAVYPHRKQTKLVKEFITTVQDYIGSPTIWEKMQQG
ncbi:Transcriptional regulator, AsnC family [Vibrio coralliirubri]|uniref:LysR family transcriptional regulator n=1 Tax=Vibrio coralliirubri TaxID=1516159 RepID=UPI000631A9C0|nr:LysR family transcriptional regulator [Vibrio coralliirubri]CDT77707.1 Transcriptional regulator, AsnC family [Vibrio coralliirubri]